MVRIAAKDAARSFLGAIRFVGNAIVSDHNTQKGESRVRLFSLEIFYLGRGMMEYV